MNKTKSLHDQILPLVLPFAIQINISSPTREHLSPKVDGSTRRPGQQTTMVRRINESIYKQHTDRFMAASLRYVIV
jgi:hypothetical protein